MATRILPGIVIGSSRIPDDRFLEDQADTGDFRVRRVTKRRHWTFNLVWKNRSMEDMRVVEDFWSSVRDSMFEYEWPLDKRIYLAHFISPPTFKPETGTFWEIRVSILGRLKP